MPVRIGIKKTVTLKLREVVGKAVTMKFSLLGEVNKSDLEVVFHNEWTGNHLNDAIGYMVKNCAFEVEAVIITDISLTNYE